MAGGIALGLVLLGSAGFLLRSHLAPCGDSASRSAPSGVTFQSRSAGGTYGAGFASGFYTRVLERARAYTG